METTIKATPKSWRVLTIIYSAILASITYMAYRNTLPTEYINYPHLDKVGHFILVGFAAFLFHKLFKGKKIIKNKIALGPLLVMLIFAIDEYAQKFSAVRTCSLYDFMANTSGVVFFMLVEKRWPEMGPIWVIEKLQRVCAFLYCQLGKLKEK